MDALDRTLQPTRRVLGDVDPAQPLDLTHPLLKGVQGFWLPLPRLVGGSRLYDLSANSHHGDFSGLTSSDWSTDAERQFPFLTFPNDGDQVNCGRVHGSLDELTVFFWIRPLSDNSGIIQKGKARSRSDKHDWEVSQDNENLVLKISNEKSILSVKAPTLSLQEWHFVVCTWDGETAEISVNGEVRASTSLSIAMSNNHDFYIGGDAGSDLPSDSSYSVRFFDGSLTAVAVLSSGWVGSTEHIYDQARRGFPDLLRRRDSVGLLGGGVSPISGTAAITDAQEQITATGQTKVSGTLSVTGGSETLTVDGAVITTGTAQITDAAEDVTATGEVKIAGTVSLADGTEEVIIVGQNDVTGSLSFADLAAEIAATGAVDLQGSFTLTDSAETITARQRIPARLANVDVRLEDIIVVHATLEDALTVDAKLTD